MVIGNQSISGFLNLYKPRGCTSRAAIDKIKKLIKPLGVGHTGTLDHAAEGVLVVAVGDATKLIPYLEDGIKCYRGVLQLGAVSPSLDADTPIERLPNSSVPTAEELRSAAQKFVGTLQQIPPLYSAKKIRGRRASDLTRWGEDVRLAAREVRIDRCEVIAYEYPLVTLEVTCTTGTYMRALGRDLAEALSTQAVMMSLCRTVDGDFSVNDSLDLSHLTIDRMLDHLRSPLTVVQHLPIFELNEVELDIIEHGQFLPRDTQSPAALAIDAQKRLRAILVPRRPGLLGPKRVFKMADEPSKA